MNSSPAWDDQPNPSPLSYDSLAAFDTIEPAPKYTPLPPGTYVARVVKGACCTTTTGREGYRLQFQVTEGPHAGTTLVRTWVFTPKALPYTRRDLGLLGLTSAAALQQPFPPAGKEYLVRLVVALQRGDDGVERNDVKRVELLAVNDSPVAEFLLPPPSEGGPT